MAIDEGNFEIRIQREFARAGYGIWIMKTASQGGTYVAKPIELEFEHKAEGAFLLPEPSLHLGHPAASSFMKAMHEQLVEQGFTAGSDKTAGQLEAQKEHLRDLQKLVFNYEITTNR